jgi:hypothetical protein
MSIHCSELNKSFDSKEELFVELKANKSEIVAIKKAQILKSHEKGTGIKARPLDYSKLSTETKGIKFDEDYYYIAVSTSKVLDSHDDLHLDGMWNRTVTARQGKNYLVADHELKIDNTIARKEYVEMLTAIIPFSALGKDYEGDTEALIYKVRKDKVIHAKAKEWLDSGDDIEASVRMQYVDIVLAMKSDDKDDIKERKNFDELYDSIANKADFEEEIMYFWGIKEAKNVLESSLVLFGSNSTTGQISHASNDKKQKPLIKDTSVKNSQPPVSTDVDYEFLTKNIFKNKEND